MSDLGKDEHGRDIIDVGIIVRNTGDGLSAAMQADPGMALDLVQGGKVFLVIEAEVIDVHWPVEDKKYPAIGGVRRQPVLRAGLGTLVGHEDASLREVIEKQRDRNRRWRDEQAGQLGISEAILLAEHAEAKHARKRRPECPECDRELEAEAIEKAEGDNNVVPIER